eukprot:160809_1
MNPKFHYDSVTPKLTDDQTRDQSITFDTKEPSSEYPATLSAVDKYGQTAKRVSVELEDSSIAHLERNAKTVYPQQAVPFDASSHDMDDKPCVSVECDFGDESPKKTAKEPIIQHSFERIRHYPTTVTVTDQHEQKENVIDADSSKTSRIDVRPPVAVLESKPKETLPREQVDFDAPKSKDIDMHNSPQVTTKGPYTKHPFQKIGKYPVTVSSVYLPTAHLEGNPTAVKHNEYIHLDASRSHDW